MTTIQPSWFRRHWTKILGLSVISGLVVGGFWLVSAIQRVRETVSRLNDL